MTDEAKRILNKVGKALNALLDDVEAIEKRLDALEKK